MGRALFVSILLCCAASAWAQASDDNAEMAEIVAADQAARSGPIDPQEMIRTDADRRRRTRELFDAGALTTANDFHAAAFIFQHGGAPEDYLLAHIFAVRSLALGRKDAEWIAAASLDRYLHNTGKSQVYGTQYKYTPESGATMEPYDRTLLTDNLRVAAGTHTVAEQEARLDEMTEQMKALVPATPPQP